MYQSVAPDGQPVTTIADPQDGTYVAAKPTPTGGLGVSYTQPSADGGKLREDISISPQGIAGNTNSTNYPTSPPPLYPGDPGGTAVSGGTGTGTTAGGSACGGPGQPACVTTIDSGGRGEGDLPDGASQAAGFSDATSFLDPVKGRLSGFFDFQLPSHSSQCPALSVDFTAWGLDIHQSSGFLCDWLYDNQALMQGLMQFVFLASALVIVLRA
jgi:hypothetical protein